MVGNKDNLYKTVILLNKQSANKNNMRIFNRKIPFKLEQLINYNTLQETDNIGMV